MSKENRSSMFGLPFKVFSAAAALGYGAVEGLTTSVANVVGRQAQLRGSQTGGVVPGAGSIPGLSHVGAPESGLLTYFDSIDNPANATSIARGSRSAQIETPSGEFYEVEVIEHGIGSEIWWPVNGSTVSAGEILASGHDMSVMVTIPPGAEMSTSMLDNVVNTANNPDGRLVVNAGSHPDNPETVQTNLLIDSDSTLAVTVGDNVRITQDSPFQDGSPLQVSLAHGFSPIDVVIDSVGEVNLVSGDAAIGAIDPVTGNRYLLRSRIWSCKL